ncbi:MAG TPA: RDD family protein [Solirubrobacteraceae bacterium]|nr:RDD family protein [Solirubrobacteraceae bacterium]
MAPDPDQPPVSRLLKAGAKGAERVARATGVDRALDEAVEEAIVRALNSEVIDRAIERAVALRAPTVELNAEEIAQLVKRGLDSEAGGRIWAEVLASEQMQMLVERIAGAPEIRAAIAAQSAGLITDIGVRLTRLTEALDDTMERVVRPRDEADSETDQAGLATRLVAAGIDLGLLFAVYSLASGVLASIISVTFGQQLSLAAAIVLGVLGFLAAGAVFSVFWALVGQTPGMRFLSIRLTYHGSRDITLGLAARRFLAVILSVIPFGLGFLAVLRDPSRRAWHDRMTGTEVVYDAVQRAPFAGTAPGESAGERAA